MSNASIPKSMKACRVEKYGDPKEVLDIATVKTPGALKSDEVLVKIHYASLNAGDYHIVRGSPFVMKLMFGSKRPNITALGSDFAGVIVQTGLPSTSSTTAEAWKIGDLVCGDLSDCGFGAISEYCIVKTKFLVKVDGGNEDGGKVNKEEELSLMKEVCALPVAGTTALGALRQAKVKAGDKVLVVGASGGVGHFAVQIASKVMGAEVTGVCSTRNLEMVVEHCGASFVIDYTKETDFLYTRKSEFDVILDCANDRTATNDTSLALKCLKPKGRYVMIGGKNVFRTMFFGQVYYARRAGAGKRCIMHMGMANPKLCAELLEFFKEGKVKPYVSAVYPLEQTIDAMVIMDSGRTRGKMVVEVSS